MQRHSMRRLYGQMDGGDLHIIGDTSRIWVIPTYDLGRVGCQRN